MIFIGIDWSGRRDYGNSCPIQVARCDEKLQLPFLVVPADGLSFWTRTAVGKYLRDLFSDMKKTGDCAVVGMDFAFSFPYEDKGCYFPKIPNNIPDASALWKCVDTVMQLAKVGDYYAGDFCRSAPYKAFFHLPRAEVNQFAHRLRTTEQECALQYPVTPNSVFQNVGAKSVGIGSLAGMRLFVDLMAQRTAGTLNFALWPFEFAHTPTPGQQIILLEAYPALFSTLPFLPSVPAGYTKDQKDAFLASAGVRHFADQPAFWSLLNTPVVTRLREGWIFGVAG